MKINWPAKKSFCEGVAYGFEFVTLSPKLEPLHAPVQCKDFLTDMFWSEFEQKPAGIYGFSWKPGALDINERSFRFALKYKNEPMHRYAEALAKFMKSMDLRMGFSPRSTVIVDESERIMVATVPRGWVQKPILVSALTLFLRVGCAYEGGPLPEFLEGFPARTAGVLAACDKMYVKSALANGHLQRLLAGDRDFAQKWSDYATCTGTLHGTSGIVYFKEAKKA